MKYKTLIWSGCSHSFGSGMFKENNYKPEDNLDLMPVIWCNPKCYDDFPNVVSVSDAMRDVAARTYPNQICKRMGFENTYNLSLPGRGIESQLRKVTSFIINNEDTIDFTKAVFCYQIPALNRVEILDMRNNEGVIEFANHNFQNISENEEIIKNYFVNHFDFDYWVARFLMHLYEYKGFLESKGITFLPFHFISDTVLNSYELLYPYLKSEEYMIGPIGMNKKRLWEHVDVRFPKRKTMIEKINYWDVRFDYPTQPTTLISDGYCKDYHWSPKGHDILADNMIPQLKEKLGI